MVNWARMESKLLVFVMILYVHPPIGAKHYLVKLAQPSPAHEVDKEEGKREDHQYAKDNVEEHARVKYHGG